jgi:hypothetical protein
LIEIVEKVAGDRFDVLCAKNVFAEWSTIDNCRVSKGQTTPGKCL